MKIFLLALPTVCFIALLWLMQGSSSCPANAKAYDLVPATNPAPVKDDVNWFNFVGLFGLGGLMKNSRRSRSEPE
jgi:hypothetical protein